MGQLLLRYQQAAAQLPTSNQITGQHHVGHATGIDGIAGFWRLAKNELDHVGKTLGEPVAGFVLLAAAGVPLSCKSTSVWVICGAIAAARSSRHRARFYDPPNHCGLEIALVPEMVRIRASRKYGGAGFFDIAHAAIPCTPSARLRCWTRAVTFDQRHQKLIDSGILCAGIGVASGGVRYRGHLRPRQWPRRGSSRWWRAWSEHYGVHLRQDRWQRWP